MKMNLFFASVALTVAATSFADTKVSILGSDTMGGVMTDAIIAAGLNQQVTYSGGGSGVGELALANGEITLTAMSREMKSEMIAKAQANGIIPVAHVVGLDGIGIFANDSTPLATIDLSTLGKIFTCEITSWNQIPGSGKNGPIKAYRRDDLSGTTDTFKNLVGVKTFGSCVTILAETADIADKTATEAEAIGYAGLSAYKQGNHTIAIAVKAGAAGVQPSTTTIRNSTYPLARKLYIYEATGTKTPAGVELELLGYVLDRSFLDPILQDHDFITLD